MIFYSTILRFDKNKKKHANKIQLFSFDKELWK